MASVLLESLIMRCPRWFCLIFLLSLLLPQQSRAKNRFNITIDEKLWKPAQAQGTTVLKSTNIIKTREYKGCTLGLTPDNKKLVLVRKKIDNSDMGKKVTQVLVRVLDLDHNSITRPTVKDGRIEMTVNGAKIWEPLQKRDDHREMTYLATGATTGIHKLYDQLQSATHRAQSNTDSSLMSSVAAVTRQLSSDCKKRNGVGRDKDGQPHLVVLQPVPDVMQSVAGKWRWKNYIQEVHMSNTKVDGRSAKECTLVFKDESFTGRFKILDGLYRFLRVHFLYGRNKDLETINVDLARKEARFPNIYSMDKTLKDVAHGDSPPAPWRKLKLGYFGKDTAVCVVNTANHALGENINNDVWHAMLSVTDRLPADAPFRKGTSSRKQLDSQYIPTVQKPLRWIYDKVLKHTQK